MESEAPYNDEHLGDRLGRQTLRRASEYFATTAQQDDTSTFSNKEEIKELSTASPEERARYQRWVDVLAWITTMRSAARGNVESARLATTNILHFTNDAITGETFDSFLPVLPAIMTSHSFMAAKRQGIEDYCVKDGLEIYQSAYELFLEAVEYFLSQLEKDPEADNPLKAIQERYEAEPIKSQHILSIWHRVHNNGYYERAGKKSAILTKGEFDKLIEQERWKDLYDIIKNYLEGGSIGFEKDLEEDPEGPLQTTWHYATGKPAGLTKWQAIHSLGKLYDGEEPGLIKDLANEFPELLSAISDRVSKDYKLELLHTPLKEWKKPFMTRRRLCKMGYYTLPQKAGTYYKQKEPTGIAVLQDVWDVDTTIYAKPRRILYQEQTLEGYIDECGASRKSDIIGDRKRLLDSYYFIVGYNTAIDLISELYGLPGFKAVRVDTTPIENAVNAIRCVVELLFSVVAKLPESDKLRTKKLQVVRDYFLPPRLKNITLPRANVKKASKLIKSMEGFKAERFNELYTLLVKRPTPGGQKDGQPKPRE